MLTLMVTNGFSLLEIRKLYLDELFDYYKYLFFHLEAQGMVKKGTYEKLDGATEKDDDTVGKLRKQLFKIKASNKK